MNQLHSSEDHASLADEIGGDFSYLDMKSALEDSVLSRPREGGGALRQPIVFSQSGRQALYLIGRELRRDGVTTIYVPEFHCESIGEPLLACNLNVRYLQCDSSGGLIADDFASKAYDDATAVLVHETFGNALNPEVIRVLENITSSGVPTIYDRTHGVFAEPAFLARFEFGSLRKVLPIPEGAFVRGLVLSDATPPSPNTLFSDLRTKAFLMKAQYLSGRVQSKAHLALFREAEEVLADGASGFSILSESQKVIEGANLAAYKQRRQRNGQRLAERLADLGVEVVNREGISRSPIFVVAAIGENTRMQAALADEGIYCPVHWPRPKYWPLDEKWDWPFISFPIDHRYTLADMDRIAASVQSYLKKAQ